MRGIENKKRAKWAKIKMWCEGKIKKCLNTRTRQAERALALVVQGHEKAQINSEGRAEK